MHIVELISGSSCNGAVVHCMQVSRALEAMGHRVTIWCPPQAWIARELQTGVSSIVELPIKYQSWSALKRMSAWIRDQQPDILHTHMSQAHACGVILKQLTRIPCVATAHSRRIQLHWRWNDRLIAVSDAVRRFHIRYNLVPPGRIETIHNFVESQVFEKLPPGAGAAIRAELGVPQEVPVLAVVGEVTPAKGWTELLECLPRVKIGFPHVRLLAVGEASGPFASRLKRLSATLGMAENIVWCGFRTDVPAVLMAADLVVSGSRDESCPLSVLEGMAAGRAVVATRVGGTPEVVVDGQTGLLVAPGNAEALAVAITRTLADHQLRDAMGRAGQDRVKEHFAPIRQVARIERTLGAATRVLTR